MACNDCKPIAPWIKEKGISRTIISYILLNNFHIPEEFKDCLEEYYILHYSGASFSSKVFDGTIERNNTEYIVLYKNCTPYKVRRAASVKVSFRTPSAIFNLPSYALVSIVDSEEN